MKKLKNLLFCILFLSFTVKANMPVHNSRTYVDDFAGILTPEQETSIDQQIRSYMPTGVEISVVTIHTTGDRDIESYANELFNTWGIGKKDVNNGILILVAVDDHACRTELGDFVTYWLTDGKTGEIAENILPTYFRAGDYAGGISKLMSAYMDVLGPATIEERTAMFAAQKKEKEAESIASMDAFWNLLYYFIIIAIVGCIGGYLIYQSKKKKREAREKLEATLTTLNSIIAGFTDIKKGLVSMKNTIDRLKTMTDFGIHLTAIVAIEKRVQDLFVINEDSIGSINNSSVSDDYNNILKPKLDAQRSTYNELFAIITPIDAKFHNIQKFNNDALSIIAAHNRVVAKLITDAQTSDKDTASLISAFSKGASAGLSPHIANDVDSLIPELVSALDGISKKMKWKDTKLVGFTGFSGFSAYPLEDMKSAIALYQYKLKNLTDKSIQGSVRLRELCDANAAIASNTEKIAASNSEAMCKIGHADVTSSTQASYKKFAATYKLFNAEKLNIDKTDKTYPDGLPKKKMEIDGLLSMVTSVLRSIDGNIKEAERLRKKKRDDEEAAARRRIDEMAAAARRRDDDDRRRNDDSSSSSSSSFGGGSSSGAGSTTGW